MRTGASVSPCRRLDLARQIRQQAEERYARSRFGPVEFGLRSERVFDAQLNDTAVVGRRDLTEGRRADRAVGLPEAFLVEDVERLDAQLHLLRTGDDEVLEKRQVGAAEPRTAHR